MVFYKEVAIGEGQTKANLGQRVELLQQLHRTPVRLNVTLPPPHHRAPVGLSKVRRTRSSFYFTPIIAGLTNTS